MLMPSHAKIVQPYREPQPLFATLRRRGAARRDVLATQVTLKSGGYIVINQTEALVSIDVNSGRSTREHNIEDTALKTNLEAAEEIARQLRLRDLAGLIVIDFIDMEEKRNNRAVEKKLKDCLKNDRARIQVGRISPFGLLEMSRQRIRTGVLESSSIPCPHCAGTGYRARRRRRWRCTCCASIEETLIKSASHNLVVRTRTEVALYILNQKRVHLRELETRFGVTITIVADESLTGTTTYAIERGEPALAHRAQGARHRRPDRRHRARRRADEDEIEVEEDRGARTRPKPPRQPAPRPLREERDEDEATAMAAAAAVAAAAAAATRSRRRRRRPHEGAEAGGERGATDEDDAEGEAAGEAAAPRGSGADVRRATAAAAAAVGPPRRPRPRPRREPREERSPCEDGFVASTRGVAEVAMRGRADRDARRDRRTPGAWSRRPTESRAGGRRRSRARQRRPARRARSSPRRAGGPEPEPVAVVLTPPDPDRPKRAGWWSKAKSVLSGS